KREAAEIARKEGNTAAALFFESASKDEARHKAGIKGILEKL
ncbi:MAG: rubrerythrin family protein, partial [ANME-2 cluster archaeon]